MESRRLTSTVLLLALVASAVAVPLSRTEQCARHCTESNRFQYTPGTTYTYDYETTTATTVKGTTRDRSQLQLRAKVDIEVLSKCELSLRLRGVTLKQSDPESPDYLNPVKGGRQFASSLERHTVRFSFQDGRVQELCLSEDVPTWITNIHRGVLSALQNSMDNLDMNQRVRETDVSGNCEAEYQSLKSNWQGVLTVEKVKDLNSCMDRHRAGTVLQATPFTQGSTIQSTPLVSGSQKCEQKIRSGILQSASCSEEHVFRPFSKNSGGAITLVHQKLVYSTLSKMAFTGDHPVLKRQGLLYDHGTQKEEAPSKTKELEAEQALKKLCAASADDITINVPSAFAALVANLKQLKSLGNFYRRIDALCPNHPKAKKFFMDAVPMVATKASVHFMTEMISKQEVDKAEANYWFTTLSIVTDPTAEMISMLTPLLEGPHEQAFLGISSLVHTFCKSNACENMPEVRALVDKLAENLGESCFDTDEKKILLTLKAIGNIGFPFGKERILEQCSLNPQLKIEMRIAAIQAFRRFSCDVPVETFLNTYKNCNEDSELRIAAYLASVKCMEPSVLQQVKNTLEEERVNQVGSFVWTHLQALAKSSHPERQDIKAILSNLNLLNKYQSDIRKFSSAQEASIFLDSIKSGIHVDTHLVFPTNSFLPRSATVNFTVDIFGHSCNLLQMDGRMEGLERTIESFFGPGGYFPQKQVAKLIREKRSLSDKKLEWMDQEFKEKRTFRENPYASLDVKVFGNSLWYNQFEEGEEGQTTLNLMDILSELAQKREKELSRSFVFLDSTYTVPMATGLPLKLALNGTASVSLKLGGKFKVRSLRDVDVQAYLQPSGAVEMAALLSVEAGEAARSGLRIGATLHSSTVLDSKLEVHDGKLVKAEINMPREKIEIIDIQSRLHLVYGSEEREQPSREEDGTHIESCTGPVTRRAFGVELCSKVRLPGGQRNSPMYPLSGPATFSLFLRKTDPTLSKYTFDASWETKMMNGMAIRQGAISLNTPESSLDREVKMQFHLSQPDGTLSFEAKTPAKKFGLRAKFANTDSLKKLDLSTSVDDKDVFSVRSEIRSEAEKGAFSHSCVLEVAVPTRKLLSISGSSHLRHGKKYSGQLDIQGLTEQPVVLKGSLDVKEPHRCDAEFSLSSFGLDTTVKGYVQAGDTMFVKVSADYRLMNSKTYKVSINGKVRDLSANSLAKYTGVLNMQASAFPEWDTSVSWESMRTSGLMENTVSFAIGDGTRSRVHTIDIQEIVKYKGSLYDNTAEVTLKLNYPERNINYAFQMKHMNTPRKLDNSIAVQYARNREVSTAIQLEVEPGKSFVGDIKVKYPGRDARLMTELSEVRKLDYKAAVTVQWHKGQRTSVVAHYRNKGDNTKVKHEADAEITFSSRSPITLSATVGANRGQYAGMAEMSLGLEKYRVAADYGTGPGVNHRISGTLLLGSESYSTEGALQASRDKLTANAELKFPNLRRVTAKFDVKRSRTLKTLSAETFWDADRDQSKRYGIDGEIRLKAVGYETKVIIQAQEKTIKGLVTTSREGEFFGSFLRSAYKAELLWSPREKFTASLNTNMLREQIRTQLTSTLEVQTPYKDYKKLSLSVTHGGESQQWNNEIAATWGAGKSVSLSSGGRFILNPTSASMDADLNFRSPFQKFEHMYLNLSHYQDAMEFSNQIHAQWTPSERITTNLYRSSQDSMFRAGMKIKTPFSVAQDVSAEVTQTYSSGNYKTKAEFQWAPRQKINSVIDFQQDFRARRQMYSVNVVTSSPFRGFENTVSKIVYNNNGDSLNLDAEAHWNRQAITFGASAASRNSHYNKNMEGKIYFTSPFDAYENLKLDASLQATGESHKINLDAQMPYNKKVSFNSEGAYTSFHNIEWNAGVSGDFTRVTAGLAHKFHNSNLRSSLEMLYGKNKIVTLITGSTNTGYKSYDLEGSMTIKTPFTGYEDMKLEVTQGRKENEMSLRMEANMNRENILIVNTINVKDNMNFESELHITSSVAGIRNVRAATFQSQNPGYFTHRTDIRWEQKQVSLNAQYQDKLSKQEFIVKLSTPLEQLKSLELSAEQESGQAEYKSKLAIEWNEREKINMQSSFSNYRFQQVNGEVRITSNIRRSSHVYELTGKYDVMKTKKTADLAFQWDQGNSKRISMSGSVLMDPQSPQLDVTVTTPFNDFKEIALNVQGKNRQREKQITVVYEKNSQKLTATAKLEMQNEGALCEVSFSSPFRYARQLQASAKYQASNSNGLSGEVFYQWDQDKKVSILGEITKTRNTFDGVKLSLSTPFSAYETASLDVSSDFSGLEKLANVVCRWNEKKVELSVKGQSPNGNEGSFSLDFSSPFRNYEKITSYCSYKLTSSALETDVKLDLGRNKVYTGEVRLFSDRKSTVRLMTPHQSARNVQLTVDHDIGTDKLKKVELELKWANQNINVMLFYNSDSMTLLDSKVVINTSFESFRKFSVEGTVRNQHYPLMEATLKLVTPFESLPMLEISGNYKSDIEFYEARLVASTAPEKAFTVSGQVSKGISSKPFELSLNMDNTFTADFKSAGFRSMVDYRRGWTNANAEFKLVTPRSTHTLTTLLKLDEGVLAAEIKMTSPLMKDGRMDATAKALYSDSQSMSMEATATLGSDFHKLAATYQQKRQDIEMEAKLSSSALPEGKAGMKVIILQRRKNAECSLVMSVPSSVHRATARYDRTNKQVAGSVTVESSFLSSSPIVASGKYVNANSRDLELTLEVTALREKHGLVASLKNYDGEKFLQLIVECPRLNGHRFSVTGTLKNDGLDILDGVLTVSMHREEIRIAGNMKRNGLKNIDAFLILNTPYEPLRMLRIDSSFKNDNSRNIDVNLQLETSNENLRNLGFTAKLIRAQGSEDLSLALRLPAPRRATRTYQLLGNLHYSMDFKTADSKLTFTLPSGRHSVNGHFVLGEDSLTLGGELECEGKVFSGSGRIDMGEALKGMSMSVTTPRKGTYGCGLSAGNSNGRYSFGMSYNDPTNRPLNVTASLNYRGASNVVASFSAVTPFEGFREMEMQLNHLSQGDNKLFDLMFAVEGSRAFVKAISRRDDVESHLTVNMGSPCKMLRNFDLSYSQKIEIPGRNLEISYNGDTILRAALTLSSGYVNYLVEMPMQPMTISAKLKLDRLDRQIIIKSKCPTRTMSFRATNMDTQGFWSHEAVFVWDEEARKQGSYNLKITDSSKGDVQSKELFVRCNLPLRSMEMKGKYTKSGRVQSGGMDLFWDVNRDPSKHLALGFEHQDGSNREQTSHKVQLTLTHPSLPKDLVQTNYVMFSAQEIHCKSELQYSRDQERHMTAEFRATDMSRHRRDSRFKAELSLRHPVTMLDTMLTADVASTAQELVGHLVLNHLNRNRRQTVHEIKAKIVKVRNQIVELLMRSDENQLSLVGKMTNRDNEMSVSLDQRFNHRQGLHSHVRFDRRRNTLDVNVTVAESKGLHFGASLTEDSASMRLTHLNEAGSNTDTYMYMRLEKSKILKSGINWKPGMWRDFRIATGETLREVSAKVMRATRAGAAELTVEWQRKSDALVDELSGQLRPFANQFAKDGLAVMKDLEMSRAIFDRMYEDNEFFMRDAAHLARRTQRVVQKLFDTACVVAEAMYNITAEFTDDIYDIIFYTLEDFSVYAQLVCRNAANDLSVWSRRMVETANRCIGRLQKQCGDFAERAWKALEAKVRTYAPCVIDAYYHVRIFSDKVRETVRDTVNSVAKCVADHPLTIALGNYYSRVISTVRTFQMADLTAGLKSNVLFLGEKADAFLDQLTDMQLVELMRNRIPIDYVAGAAQVSLQKAAELYDTLGLDQMARSLFFYCADQMKSMALSSGQEVLQDFYHLQTGAKYSFDPKKGAFSFEYTLPTPKSNLYEVFHVTQYLEARKLNEIRSALLTKYYEDFCIWDAYYAVKNFFSLNYWLPPFKAHAMVAGNQHFVTFDKFAFDFAGECSYLLTRDFVDGNFTVVANYRRDGSKVLRKSLTVLSEGRKFEVANDYKLLLDDVKVEMPVRAGNTVVVRVGASIRIESEHKGFAVVCNFVHDICTVDVSGFYFAKTGGLFGTYDHEPRLDMMTPERRLATDVETFANSWEVSKESCGNVANMATLEGNSYAVQEKCKSFFAKSSSPFRAGFKQVDPEPYLRMCIRDLSAVDESRFDATVCTSAAAYFTECGKENIQLKMPKHCVECEQSHGKPMSEGDIATFTADNPTHTADVVFVVEEKKCNEEKFRYLSKLSHSIEDGFRKKGFLDIRYRVVGFGGSDIHAKPHVHTMDGQEHGNVRALDLAFLTLEAGDGPVNMLEALRFAAALNFRPGTSKTFILVKCSTCKAEEGKAEYGEMLRTLIDGDISLHLLMEQKYEMRIASKNSKAKKVIGLDKNFAYTLKDIKDSNLIGDGDLLVQLKVPKDICIPLALEVNGSTFDSQYLTETRRNTNKKFVDVLSRRIAKSANQRPQTPICCECIANAEGVGKSVCQRCVSPEVASMISADATPFYNNELQGRSNRQTGH